MNNGKRELWGGGKGENPKRKTKEKRKEKSRLRLRGVIPPPAYHRCIGDKMKKRGKKQGASITRWHLYELCRERWDWFSYKT